MIPVQAPVFSIIPSLIFILGLMVMVIGSAIYAYSHLLAAQADDIAKLRREGVLSGDPARDYEAITFLLDSIAPAVAIRTEYWVISYSWIVRVLSMLGARDWTRIQMQRLIGHQALRYKNALTTLNSFRAF